MQAICHFWYLLVVGDFKSPADSHKKMLNGFAACVFGLQKEKCGYNLEWVKLLVHFIDEKLRAIKEAPLSKNKTKLTREMFHLTIRF